MKNSVGCMESSGKKVMKRRNFRNNKETDSVDEDCNLACESGSGEILIEVLRKRHPLKKFTKILSVIYFDNFTLSSSDCAKMM